MPSAELTVLDPIGEGLAPVDELRGQSPYEQTDICDNAKGLVASSVCKLGHDGLVDVDAVGLYAGWKNISRCNRMQG